MESKSYLASKRLICNINLISWYNKAYKRLKEVLSRPRATVTIHRSGVNALRLLQESGVYQALNRYDGGRYHNIINTLTHNHAYPLIIS